MNIGKNCRLMLLRRKEIAQSVIELRLTMAEAARIYGVRAKIVASWIEHYCKEGRQGILDCSARPR